MRIRWGVKFLLHIRHGGDTTASVRMRITIRGLTPLDFPTGYRLGLDAWDTVRMRARAGSPGAQDINRTIDEWKAIVNDIFARYEIIEKRTPTMGEVRDLFNDMTGRTSVKMDGIPSPSGDFFAIYDTFTQTMGARNQWTAATFGKFAALRKHLWAFDRRISFPQLTEGKMQSYLIYLNKQGMRNTTIAKHLSFVRWFLRWASANGFYDGHLHETFRPKLKGTDGNSKEVIYLTGDDMEKMMSYQFSESEKHLELKG